MKVTVEFDSIEQAAAAVAAVSGGAPAYAPPAPAAAPVYAPPAPAAPQGYPPAPPAQPAPGGGWQAPLAPAPAPAPAYAPPPPQGAPVSTGGYTQAQVAQAAQAYARKHGPKGAKAVLAEFGLQGVANATPDMYPALIARLAV